MPRTLYEIDLNHCRYYLTVFSSLNGTYQQEGAEQAYEKLREKWPNILLAQEWCSSQATSDREAARCCIEFGRKLFSGSAPIFLSLSNEIGTSWSRKAVESARYLELHEDLAYLLATLASTGSVSSDDKVLSDSEAFFHEAITLFRELDDRHGVSYCNAHLGSILTKTARLDEAAAAFDNALRTAKGIDRPRQTVHLICAVYRGLAVLSEKRGSIMSARDCLCTACTVAREGSCLGCEAGEFVVLWPCYYIMPTSMSLLWTRRDRPRHSSALVATLMTKLECMT